MKKVLGIGNALLDILVRIENDSLLEHLGLPKGSMQLVGKERSDEILDSVGHLGQQIASGGSAANTVHGIACLGGKAGYIGVIGADDFGDRFVNDMIDAGVEPTMIRSRTVTGRAVALISPDSERTFATFLGAAVELNESDLTQEQFKHCDILHLEGYLVQNHALVEKAVSLARKEGTMISLDLASYNVVEANRTFLEKIVREYVDILFANEEEAFTFTGLRPDEALKFMQEMAGTVILKTGAKGSMISYQGMRTNIGVLPVSPIDTTGAGDLYAAGFLYGISMDMPLERCGWLGAQLAGNVIGVLGAKLPAERWHLIREQMKL